MVSEHRHGISARAWCPYTSTVSVHGHGVHTRARYQCTGMVSIRARYQCPAWCPNTSKISVHGHGVRTRAHNTSMVLCCERCFLVSSLFFCFIFFVSVVNFVLLCCIFCPCFVVMREGPYDFPECF